MVGLGLFLSNFHFSVVQFNLQDLRPSSLISLIHDSNVDRNNFFDLYMLIINIPHIYNKHPLHEFNKSAYQLGRSSLLFFMQKSTLHVCISKWSLIIFLKHIFSTSKRLHVVKSSKSSKCLIGEEREESWMAQQVSWIHCILFCLWMWSGWFFLQGVF